MPHSRVHLISLLRSASQPASPQGEALRRAAHRVTAAAAVGWQSENRRGGYHPPASDGRGRPSLRKSLRMRSPLLRWGMDGFSFSQEHQHLGILEQRRVGGEETFLQGTAGRDARIRRRKQIVLPPIIGAGTEALLSRNNRGSGVWRTGAEKLLLSQTPAHLWFLSVRAERNSRSKARNDPPYAKKRIAASQP